MEVARSSSTGALAGPGRTEEDLCAALALESRRSGSRPGSSRKGSKDGKEHVVTGRPMSAGLPLAEAFAELDLSLRPGSQEKASMTRLPDEPHAIGGRSSPSPKTTSGGWSSSAGSSARPTSAGTMGITAGGTPQRGPSAPGLMRLPDEPLSPAPALTRRLGSKESASTKANRPASLSRLPDEIPGLRPISAGDESRPRQGSKDGMQRQKSPSLPLSDAMERTAVTASAASSKGTGGGFRDRLNKNLTVTTAPSKKVEKNVPRVFRTLKDGETIADYFDFAEEIYNGGDKGKIMMAKQRTNGVNVVVKIRAKNVHRGGERAWRNIMSQVYGMKKTESSNHVLDILDIYEDDNSFYVIMPKCNGGELFEFLATETEVPEAECKRIIREILTAVGHLHENKLVHRDIKPENIMFDLMQDDPTSPKTVKLIDFDTCFGWGPGTPKSRRFVGTPGYIAPEALLGEICPQSDLWSIGVILYILMTGEMPWSSLVSLEDGVVGSPGAIKMYNGLKAEVMDWDKEPWPEFPLAMDLCQRLMAFEVSDRLDNVQQALDHPWLDPPSCKSSPKRPSKRPSVSSTATSSDK